MAAPISLRLSTSEGEVALTGGEPTITVSRSGSQAQIAGLLQGVIQSAHISVAICSALEFDGLLTFEVSLNGDQEDRIQGISLEIPLRHEHAVLRHKWAPAFGGVSGALPDSEGVVDSTRFVPFYWLGDNERGLFWFCETNEMWPNSGAGDAIEVMKSVGKVTLRLNLKKKGQDLPPGWKFVFGLQPTPAKPLPAGWRNWRLAPGRQANLEIMWPEPQPDSLKYYGYPEAANPRLFTERVRKIQAGGKKAVPYVCLTYLSEASPEWPLFKGLWATGQDDAVSADVGAYKAPFAMVAPSGQGWSDFIVWKTSKFLKDYHVGGLYHDNTQPYEMYAPAAGIGYLQNKQPHKACPILADRALSKRMYSVLKQHDPNSFSIAHMSGKGTVPMLVFDDAILNGEQFEGKVKGDYLDVLSLETLRAEFMGRQWGLVSFFLPELRPPYSQQVEPTRELMTLLMLHDIPVWPIWCNVEVVNIALAALDEFGYASAEFIPYFDSSPAAVPTTPNTYVSAYRNSNGRALLIIANLNSTSKDVEVTLNRERFKYGASSITEWPRGHSIPLNGLSFSVKIEGKSYLMVNLHEKPGQ